jgi:Ca2+-binding RTX toxin-like protein
MAIVKLGYSNLPMTSATANTTYVLDSDETRVINSGKMIDLTGTEGLKFVLNGSLYAPGGILEYGTQGVDAPAIRIEVGKTGYLDSEYFGLFTAADDSVIQNRGIIDTTSGEAIEMHGNGLTVENAGTLTSTGSNAIYLIGSDIDVRNSGVVNGTISIYSDVGAQSTVVNSGQINSPGLAIKGGDGEDTVINSGLIRMGIRLYDGDDRFIDKGGRATGAVQGGEGDDLYIIRSKDFDLRESDNEGFDTVKTSVSWVLDQEFEVGRLTGNKDINLTASYGGSFLYGNSGDNKLTGQLGIDWLDGGRGNDTLASGSGADVFVFKSNSDNDVITDFEDGIDKINLQNHTGIEKFGDLGVKQNGDDVIVDLGGGDTVTLRDVDKTDLSGVDFMF